MVSVSESIKKCCICNGENTGEFITINANKYHLDCIEQLQQENKQLEKQLRRRDEVIDEVIKYIEEHIIYTCDDAFGGMQFYSYKLINFEKKDLLEILQKYKGDNNE